MFRAVGDPVGQGVKALIFVGDTGIDVDRGPGFAAVQPVIKIKQMIKRINLERNDVLDLANKPHLLEPLYHLANAANLKS